MQPQLKELAAMKNRGEEPPAGFMVKVAQSNAVLQQLAFAVNGQLPTHATGNGEYTHPVVVANMAAEHLEQEAGGDLEIPLEGYEFNATAIVVLSESA